MATEIEIENVVEHGMDGLVQDVQKIIETAIDNSNFAVSFIGLTQLGTHCVPN